jgi:hypothetical protein
MTEKEADSPLSNMPLLLPSVCIIGLKVRSAWLTIAGTTYSKPKAEIYNDELKKLSLSASDDTVTSKLKELEVSPEPKLDIKLAEELTEIASLLDNNSTSISDKVSEPVFDSCN